MKGRNRMNRVSNFRQSGSCSFCEVVEGKMVHCHEKAMYRGVTDLLGERRRIVVRVCYAHLPKISQLIRDKVVAKFRHFSNVRLGCLRLSRAGDSPRELPAAA